MTDRPVAGYVAVILVLAACGGTSGGEPSAAARSVATTPAVVSTSASTGAQDPIQARLDRAVDALLDAGSYAFEIAITVSIAGSAVETELEGWVDGPDRWLLTRSGSDQVIVRVVDHFATVEREGQVTEVPLEQADEPPSLEILRSLHEATVTSPSAIAGVLNASLLKTSGVESSGGAAVTLHLAESGALAGYEMNGHNGTWAITARFFDIGESFNGLPPA